MRSRSNGEILAWFIGGLLTWAMTGWFVFGIIGIIGAIIVMKEKVKYERMIERKFQRNNRDNEKSQKTD